MEQKLQDITQEEKGGEGGGKKSIFSDPAWKALRGPPGIPGPLTGPSRDHSDSGMISSFIVQKGVARTPAASRKYILLCIVESINFCIFSANVYRIALMFACPSVRHLSIGPHDCPSQLPV